MFARRPCQGKSSRIPINALNDIVTEGGVREYDRVADSILDFVREYGWRILSVDATVAANIDSSQEVRLWVRETRRIGRIVGVIYLVGKASSDRGRGFCNGAGELLSVGLCVSFPCTMESSRLVFAQRQESIQWR